MSEVVEIAKVLVSPAEKLIDAVTGAIGILWEPVQTKRMADAKAYEYSKMASTVLDYDEISGSYQGGSINIENTATADNAPETDTASPTNSDVSLFDNNTIPMAQRIRARVEHQELLKQQNIEYVISRANQKLTGSDSIPNEPNDQEWMLHFFNTVQFICAEPLQKIWTNVLISKILNPTSVSMRTLEVLRNLSLGDALMFQKVLPYVLVRGSDCFLWCAGNVLTEFDIQPNEILHLDECGLLQSSDTLLQFKRKDSACYDNCFHNTESLVRFDFDSQNPRIRVRQFPLTSAGRELYRILRTKPQNDLLLRITESVAVHPKSRGITMTIHKHLGEDISFAHTGEVLSRISGPKIPTAIDRVDINKADLPQLMALDGIGKVYAERLIRYRSENGPFQTLDDLKNVKGIGARRFNQIKAIATV